MTLQCVVKSLFDGHYSDFVHMYNYNLKADKNYKSFSYTELRSYFSAQICFMIFLFCQSNLQLRVIQLRIRMLPSTLTIT